MGDVGVAVMRKRAGQVFVGAGTGFKDMELVGGERGGSQERTEEARWFGRIQDGYWGCWSVIQFAFIPESSLCL